MHQDHAFTVDRSQNPSNPFPSTPYLATSYPTAGSPLSHPGGQTLHHTSGSSSVSLSSPEATPRKPLLTPERFQQPVQMLRSFQQGFVEPAVASPLLAHHQAQSRGTEGTPPSLAHFQGRGPEARVASSLMTHSQPQGRGPEGPMASEPVSVGSSYAPNFMCPSGTRLDIGPPKRRRLSSSSGAALDDQGTCVFVYVCTYTCFYT